MVIMHSFVVVALLLFLLTERQIPIDATGDIKPSTKHVLGGHADTVGRRLPVDLETVMFNREISLADSVFVDFIISNRGDQPIVLPTAVSPTDVEPKDTTLAYSF